MRRKNEKEGRKGMLKKNRNRRKGGNDEKE